ncbi:hypothetical protein ACJROX_07050 [Pseudalkalibacillus sp. A8]|uniref:hypothetical protein n=1 Tax=Pseudalkalibacillus sp. A8 TaxID=3382641 RepID=UPI0038B61115
MIRVQHEEGTGQTRPQFTFEDFTTEDFKKIRTIIDTWDSLQARLDQKELAATVLDQSPLHDRRMELNANSSRSRRAYKVSEEVWKQFDEIADRDRIQKGEALEIALLDFIERYR